MTPKLGIETAGSVFAMGGGQIGRFHMMVKASAASALFVAAGLLVGFAGPSPAMAAERDNTAVSASESATTGNSVGSRYWKKRYAYRKHKQVASKSVETKKASERE